MSAGENKALARRVLKEMFNNGNIDVADELIAPDYIDHDPAMSEDIHGPEGFKEYVSAYRSAFLDLHVQIEDQIAEGDKVTYALDGHRHPRRGACGDRPHRQSGAVARDGDRAYLGRRARGGLGRLRLDDHDAAVGRHVADPPARERRILADTVVTRRALHRNGAGKEALYG